MSWSFSPCPALAEAFKATPTAATPTTTNAATTTNAYGYANPMMMAGNPAYQNALNQIAKYSNVAYKYKTDDLRVKFNWNHQDAKHQYLKNYHYVQPQLMQPLSIAPYGSYGGNSYGGYGGGNSYGGYGGSNSYGGSYGGGNSYGNSYNNYARNSEDSESNADSAEYEQ